jgi:hypothetical protein
MVMQLLGWIWDEGPARIPCRSGKMRGMGAQPTDPDDFPLLAKLRRLLDARSDLDVGVRMLDG